MIDPELLKMPIEINYRVYTFQFDYDSLKMMCIAKILGALLFIYQFKPTLKIFKPILKQYRDAEQGITQGIAMTERVHKKMKAHKCSVKKITVLLIVIILICYPVLSQFLESCTDQFIDIYYLDLQQ